MPHPTDNASGPRDRTDRDDAVRPGRARRRRIRRLSGAVALVLAAVGVAQVAGVVAVLPGDGARAQGPTGPPATVTWAATALSGSNVAGSSAGARLGAKPTSVADVLAPGQGGALRLTHPARVLVTAVVRASAIGGKPTPGACNVLVGSGGQARVVAGADLDVALASQPSRGVGAAASHVELPLVGTIDLGAGTWNARVDCVGEGDVVSDASLSLRALRAADAADGSFSAERLRGRAISLGHAPTRVAITGGAVSSSSGAALAVGAVTVTLQRTGATASCELQRLSGGRATRIATAAIGTDAGLVAGSRVPLVLDGSGAAASGTWRAAIRCSGSGASVARAAVLIGPLKAGNAAAAAAGPEASATLGYAHSTTRLVGLSGTTRTVATTGRPGRNGGLHLVGEARVVVEGTVLVHATSASGLATCTLVRLGQDGSSVPTDAAFAGGLATGAVAGSGTLSLHGGALVPAGSWRWQVRCSGRGTAVAGASLTALSVD